MSHLKNPLPNVEADTLNSFHAPVLLITYEGIKKVNITGIEKYDLLTSVGTIPKINVVFCVLAGAADKLGDALRMNKELAARGLRTAKDPRKRKKVKGVRLMRKVAGQLVKVTLLSGHILIGIPQVYNEYNFTMHVKDQVVLAYRHAVYQMEVVPEDTE